MNQNCDLFLWVFFTADLQLIFLVIARDHYFVAAEINVSQSQTTAHFNIASLID